MRHRITFMAVAAAGCLALAGVRITAAEEPAGPANDRDFVAKAAVGGSTEVALGKMALQRGTEEQVKQFAKTMVDDHTAANQELLTLAGRKQIPVPREVDAKHQKAVEQLSRLQGSEFDRAYARQMVKDHEETVALFKGEAERGQDPELKALANKLLPKLQNHLTMARRLTGEKDASVGVTGAEAPKK